MYDVKQVNYVKESKKHQTVRTARNDIQRLMEKLERMGWHEEADSLQHLRVKINAAYIEQTYEDRKSVALPH